jgi:ElaB/YqjD/DUF883 family membrane-anchored ribosome-binding protein
MPRSLNTYEEIRMAQKNIVSKRDELKEKEAQLTEDQKRELESKAMSKLFKSKKSVSLRKSVIR